jgi:transposase-like protein
MCCKNVNGVVERRFFEVEKIDQATLLPIIQNEIELGSIIYSDQWRAYSTLILKRYMLSL